MKLFKIKAMIPQFKIYRNFDMKPIQRALLSSFYQQRLEKMIATRYQQVQEFRNQVQSFSQSFIATQAAFFLFIAEYDEISKMNRRLLITFRAVFQVNKIPEALRKKHQKVLSCLSFFHFPSLSQIWSHFFPPKKTGSSKGASKCSKNTLEIQKYRPVQEQQLQLLSQYQPMVVAQNLSPQLPLKEKEVMKQELSAKSIQHRQK